MLIYTPVQTKEFLKELTDAFTVMVMKYPKLLVR